MSKNINSENAFKLITTSSGRQTFLPVSGEFENKTVGAKRITEWWSMHLACKRPWV